MPALAEPTTILLDHEPLHDADLDRIRAALDQAHLITIHAPTWSLTIRCRVLARIRFDVGDTVEIAGTIAAVVPSSVWTVLPVLGIGIAGEVVVAVRRQGFSQNTENRTEVVRRVPRPQNGLRSRSTTTGATATE